MFQFCFWRYGKWFFRVFLAAFTPELLLTQWEEGIVCRYLYVHGAFLLVESVYPIKVQHAHVPLPQFICTGLAFRVGTRLESRNAATFFLQARFLARLYNSNRIYNVVNTTLFLFGCCGFDIFQVKNSISWSLPSTNPQFVVLVERSYAPHTLLLAIRCIFK